VGVGALAPHATKRQGLLTAQDLGLAVALRDILRVTLALAA